MKKIKRIAHLRYEQKKLARRQAGLEQAIREDWDDLRHHFEPAAYAKDAVFSGLAWLGQRLLPTAGRFGRNGKKTS
jgi:hypothetical protein